MNQLGGRGAIKRRRSAFTASRSFVDAPNDPDHGSDPNDSVAASIGPLVNAVLKLFDMDITAAYDPTGGHVSPGHNITGTATDVVPRDGNWDGAFAKGLEMLAKLGFEVGYDGSIPGTENWPDHGRGNHAHIEWVGNGTAPDARKRLRTYLLGQGGDSGLSAGDIAHGALGLGLGFSPLGLAVDATGPLGGLIGGATDKAKDVAADGAGKVISAIAQLLGEKATPILLNIGLVLGGAFLFYFGVARAVGIGEPVGAPMRAARGLAAATATKGAAA